MNAPPSPLLNSSVLAAAARTAASETAALKLKDKIKKLLIANVKPSEICASIGTDPSYVSQLMADEKFAMEVLEGRANAAALRGNLNEEYDSIEGKLLEQLKNAIQMPLKTFELARLLQVVGQRKREPILPNPNENVQKVVHLHFSPKMLEKFVLDGSRNVVGIGNRSFAPLPSSELLKEVEGGTHTLVKTETLENDPGRKIEQGAGGSSEERGRTQPRLDQSNPEEI